MLNPPPRWSTQRLQALRAVPSMADDLFAGYARDPEVSRYPTWRPHEDVAETAHLLLRGKSCLRRMFPE